MAKTPEGVVKDACKKYLKSIGAWFFMPVSNGMGQVGIPDIICCYKGMFLAIETKAPGKRTNTTPNQERVIEAIRGAGGWAIVVDNVNQLEEFITSIKIFQILENAYAQINTPKT
jgi:Holliday junction resolvase